MGTGSGQGLNFGATNGANEENAPITSQHSVRYSQRKVEDYLLNISHPVGGAKAKFMLDVLGYTQADGRLFHKNVVDSIIGRQPCKTEVTTYGIKHMYKATLVSKSGSTVSANVIVIVQKDKKRITYKIVTVYPD